MKFTGRDALLRVRDSKPDTDAEHRVPTEPNPFPAPCYLLDPVNQTSFSRLGVSDQRQYHEDPHERNEAGHDQNGLEGV